MSTPATHGSLVDQKSFLAQPSTHSAITSENSKQMNRYFYTEVLIIKKAPPRKILRENYSKCLWGLTRHLSANGHICRNVFYVYHP